MMDFIIAWKNYEKGLPLAASQEMTLILKQFSSNKITLMMEMKETFFLIPVLYNTMVKSCGICPTSAGIKKNRTEWVE